MGRFVAKLSSGEPIVGTMDSLGGLPLAEVLGYAGLDFAVLDMMFCAFGWPEAQAWSRAALAYGLDPFVRLPSYPWTRNVDGHLVAEAGRAFGVGMTGVVVSVNDAPQVAELVEVSRGWHKNLHIHPFSKDTYAEYTRATAAGNVLMPLLESRGAIEAVHEILAVDGLKAAWLGVTDLSAHLGSDFDYENPRVWDFVDRAAATASARGVALCANVGYEFSRGDVTVLADRVRRMREHGIRIVALQNTGFTVQWFYRSILAALAREGPAPGTDGTR